MIGTVTDHIIPIECTLCRGRWMVWVKRPHPSSMLPDHNTNSTSVSTISTIRQFTVSRQLAYPRPLRYFPPAQFPLNANMVAITIWAEAADWSLKGELTNRGSDLAGRIIAFNHLRRLECQGALMLTADGSKSNYFRHEVEPESDDPSDTTEDMCYDGYMENGVRRRALHNHPERRRLTISPGMCSNTMFLMSRKPPVECFVIHAVGAGKDWPIGYF